MLLVGIVQTQLINNFIYVACILIKQFPPLSYLAMDIIDWLKVLPLPLRRYNEVGSVRVMSIMSYCCFSDALKRCLKCASAQLKATKVY